MPIDPSKPIQTDVGTGYAQHYSEQYRKAQEAARQADFDRAAAAGDIGLKFDEVKQLLQRLQRDLDAVPSVNSVTQLTGASKYAAEDFAKELARTVAAAGRAARVIEDALGTFASSVATTINEMAGAEGDSTVRVSIASQSLDSSVSKPSHTSAR